jgi:hypothetical protein
MYRILSIICISLLLLAGCQPHTNKESNAMPQTVTIKVGEQGAAFAKRYPDLVKSSQWLNAAGFYKIDWDKRPRGVVTIEHGQYSFKIDDVMGISGNQDLADFTKEGIFEFDVYSGMSVPAPGLVSHDEARLKMYAILQRILKAGWSVWIYQNDPRIHGKDALDYVLTVSRASSLDATYLPTFDEWMRISSLTTWYFYADHVYLSVNFTRESTLTDPTKPGAYLISFNLKSENEFYRGYVGGEHRKEWKTRLPAELAKLAPLRAAAEAKLRAQGVKIDETYQDPPLPDLTTK